MLQNLVSIIITRDPDASKILKLNWNNRKICETGNTKRVKLIHTGRCH